MTAESKARTAGKEPRPGRKAFKGMAPKGYRIRMMEPGEAHALMTIERRAEATLIDLGKVELADAPRPDIGDFVRLLVENEVFVAEDKRSGEAVGFVAAHDLPDLYWIAELSVDPAHGRRGIGRALVGAVLERACWFQHRAVGLTTYADIPIGAPFYEASGFTTIPVDDCPPWLADLRLAETPPGSDPATRCAMIRWL